MKGRKRYMGGVKIKIENKTKKGEKYKTITAKRYNCYAFELCTDRIAY